MQYSIISERVLVIHAKPSQIPFHIDRHLIERAGVSELDGANNRVSYFFNDINKLKEAEDYLSRCLSFEKKE